MAPCYGPPGTEKIAERFIHSARHFGYPEPYLYGLGRLSPGSPHGGDMQGTWVVEELEKSDADLVICCDCADVIFTGPLGYMLEKYYEFKNGFVIGAEQADHGFNQELRDGMLKLHLEAKGRYGNVNIGYWIGERLYAKDVLEKAIKLYRGTPWILDNPQAWLPYGMIKNTIDFALDRNAVIFQSCAAGDRGCIKVENGRTHNTETDTWPCCIHFNGSSGNLEAYDQLYREVIR
jgi:hypothetical protein